MSRRTITYILIAVVVTGGLFAFSRARAGQQAQAQLAELQTVEAQTGALVATIGATGTVRANQSANLLWQTSGRVELVSVEVGDEVSGGDLLAALAQTSLPQNVILAEADLVSAREALDDLYQSFEGLGLAQASQALADAEKAVAEAERYLLNVSSPAPDIDIDQAHANVVLTQSALDRAYDRYKPYENKAETNQIRAVLLNAYAQAQKDYDAAVRVLNHLTGGGSILDIGVAEADLEVAKAQLAEAQAEYDRLAAGPAADEIAAAQARVAAAEATLKHRMKLLSAWTTFPVYWWTLRFQKWTSTALRPGRTWS
jgi:multidrug efflux pump subunit AcrA (membrane-fusion protein)